MQEESSIYEQKERQLGEKRCIKKKILSKREKARAEPSLLLRVFIWVVAQVCTMKSKHLSLMYEEGSLHELPGRH